MKKGKTGMPAAELSHSPLIEQTSVGFLVNTARKHKRHLRKLLASEIVLSLKSTIFSEGSPCLFQKHVLGVSSPVHSVDELRSQTPSKGSHVVPLSVGVLDCRYAQQNLTSYYVCIAHKCLIFSLGLLAKKEPQRIAALRPGPSPEEVA
jgi:hypothetical protein